MFHSLITLTAKLAFVAGLLSHPTLPPTHTDTVVDVAPAPTPTPIMVKGADIDDAIVTVHDAGPVPTNTGYTGTLDPYQTFTINLSADFRVLTCAGPYAGADGDPATIPASSLRPMFTFADSLILSGVCQVEVK